jgi:DNA-directed RNA polymerase subunit RPC12/RpoP
MAILDKEGERIRCDRCGAEFLYDDDFHNFRWVFVDRIFYRRPKPDLPVFCSKCAKEVAPLVYALRDVDELKLYVNNLERAINEKRG